LIDQPVSRTSNVDDILTLSEAAELLDRSPNTLRHQVSAGRLRARLIGKTWVTTTTEVERYRREQIGRVGRPEKGAEDVRIVAEVAWPESYPGTGQLRILGFVGTPRAETDAIVDAATEPVLRGAWTTAEVLAAMRADRRTADIIVVPTGPSSIGIGRQQPT
jgi:hypothetical protein